MIDKMELIRHVGVLETNRTGWTKELNIIDWGSGAVYDIRSWSPGHEKCGKGVTLSANGLQELMEYIRSEIERSNDG